MRDNLIRNFNVYLTELATMTSNLMSAGITYDSKILEKVTACTKALEDDLAKLETALLFKAEELLAEAEYVRDEIRPLMIAVRSHADDGHVGHGTPRHGVETGRAGGGHSGDRQRHRDAELVPPADHLDSLASVGTLFRRRVLDSAPGLFPLFGR